MTSNTAPTLSLETMEKMRSQATKDLCQAAADNDLGGVIDALARGASSFGEDPYLRQDDPLSRAVKHANLAMCKALVEADASVDMDEHIKPAFRAESLEVLKFLAKASNFLKHVPALDGETFGVIFAEQGHVSSYEAVLSVCDNKQEFLHRKNKDGMSPLRAAIGAGSTELCEFMLNQGCKPDPESLFEAACYQPHLIGPLLRSGAKPNLVSADGNPALHGAAASGELEACAELIEAGADIALRDVRGLTALMDGARHTDVLKLLLSHGADATATSLDGQNLLMHCASRNYEQLPALLETLKSELGEETLEQLIRQDGNADGGLLHWIVSRNFSLSALREHFQAPAWSKSLEAASSANLTALMVAAKTGHTDNCAILLGAGANIEARDHMGRTPLMLAVEGGSLETCCLLLRHGADPCALNKYGMTALDVAAHQEQDGIYPCLVAAGSPLVGTSLDSIFNPKKLKQAVEDPPLLSACKTDDIDFFKWHLQRHPRPDATDIERTKKFCVPTKSKSSKAGKPGFLAYLHSHLAHLAIDEAMGGLVDAQQKNKGVSP